MAAAQARLGYIDYLNSLPIYHALEKGEVALPDGVRLVKDVPTTLNRKLLAGELDVSPISSIAYARHADELVLLPDLSINSAGFVHSVCLFYRNGLESLDGRTVSVTDESATSDILLRILLEERFNVKATRVKDEADLEDVGGKHGGVLLIGDDALKGVLAYPNLGRIDLGEEWTRWTGTPMVFAVWAARREFAEANPEAVKAVHQTLLAGKAWGRKHRSVIVERARKEVFLSRAFMERYFRDLNYDLDAPKLAGLERYYQHAARLGEIPAVPSLGTLQVSA